MIDARKDIIFRDADYKIKFKIKDGDSIKITLGYDGSELVKKCRYLDEAHLNVGNQCFHTDEFMERMTTAGNKYEPIPDQLPNLNIVVAEPGKPPRDLELPMKLNALRDILGGQPEIIEQDKFSATVQGINGNGTIAICGIKDNNLTSLHPYTAQSLKHKLMQNLKSTARKPTLAQRLEIGKEKAATLNTAPDKSNNLHKTKDETVH